MAQVSLTNPNQTWHTNRRLLSYEKQWLAFYLDFILPGSTLLKGTGKKQEITSANLDHFCMQSLTTFHTSVRNQHRAVEINVYQCCRLQEQKSCLYNKLVICCTKVLFHIFARHPICWGPSQYNFFCEGTYRRPAQDRHYGHKSSSHVWISPNSNIQDLISQDLLSDNFYINQIIDNFALKFPIFYSASA